MQVFYTVRLGETLYEIARRWKIPLGNLIAANNLHAPYTIFIGQQLSMPPGVNRVRIKPGDSVYQLSLIYGVPPASIIEANHLQPPYIIHTDDFIVIPRGILYYTVQYGDTLYKIARNFNANTELIQQFNQLPSSDISPSMRLMIPYAPPGGQGLLAYTANRDIWLYNPRSGENVQLTNGLGSSLSKPMWSSDSSKIAFVGKDNILYVLDIIKNSAASIDKVVELTSIAWAPNAKRIAYTKENRIILYDVLTHQSQDLKQIGVTTVQWFPNGEELLFQAPNETGIFQLFQMNLDGTGKSPIPNTTGPLHDIQLSPNGEFALYTTPGASVSIIRTVELMTGQTYEVKGGPLSKNYNPRWSNDSKWILYNATVYDENSGYYSQIRTVSRYGEDDQIWAVSDCFSTPVTWSTENKKIAYLSGCGELTPAKEIWILDLHHPAPIKVVEAMNITSLAWSPVAVESKIFSSKVYQVTFQYPSNWQKVSDERFEGTDGFFQIAAISGGVNIEEVCHNEAFHLLMPYGSSPRIVRTQIQKQEACFIYPSSDQPEEMRNQAAMIVKYPELVSINGATYNYFILWADKGHINELSSELTFLM